MFLRILKNVLFYLIFIPFIIIILHYIWVPQYNFSERKPFYGSKIYNPYHSDSFNQWKVLGIVSSPIWYKNLSNTFNSNQISELDTLLYDTIINISSKLFEKDKNINYSHGIIRNDIVVFNAQYLIKKSYPYYKTINNKQHTINLVKDSTSLVYLKPTAIFEDFRSNQPILLGNYDGYIADMNIEDATYLWDRSLSAGNYVSLIAESVPFEDEYTNVSHVRAIYYNQNKNIQEALRNKDFVLASIPNNIESGAKRKFKLKKVGVTNDFISISCKEFCQSIVFIGQNGVVQQYNKDAQSSIYNIKRDDSYIRVEITFKDGVKYYLNPLIRKNQLTVFVKKPVEVNRFSTILHRIMGIIGLIFIIFLILYIKRRIRIKIIEVSYDEDNKKKVINKR